MAIRGMLFDLTERNALVVHLDDRLLREPPLRVRAAIYRIVKEALSNVGDHAHALHAVIAIEPSDDGVLVTIEDDGVGFDASSVDRSSRDTGLQVMDERAKLAGGRCHVVSVVGVGTTVECWLPAYDGEPPS